LKNQNWQRAKSTEAQYARDLRSIAREIGRIVGSFDVRSMDGVSRLYAALQKYAEILEPWAGLKAALIVSNVNQQDKRMWATATKEMSARLKQQVADTQVGHRLKQLMLEQVTLIKSLPLQAADRVHKLVQENISEQKRASTIAEQIQLTGKVTEARATLIARTEVGRAAAVLTQARAENIGSAGYIWRTARDRDVRDSHKRMEGKFVPWSKPPTLDGLTGHAGALPNCRCYAEPVIPQDIE